MSSADLLRTIFRSYKFRDDEAFHAVAMQIIADEKRKNHNVLARELQQILENHEPLMTSNVRSHELEKLPRDRERGTLLVDVRVPDRSLSDIVLSENIKQQIELVLEEFRSKAILETYGLQSRRNLLFAGPPGCGKTLATEVIAGELGLPLLYTRFDAIISSYLGETAANLRKVFDFAAQNTWVVFFDEFDAIGKSRDDLEEHGELKRVVNTFLQLLDNFRSSSLFVAATNHESLLDNALWRRFDDILYFDKPKVDQIYELIQLKLRSFRHKKLGLDEVVPKMKGWSHSDIERVCIEAMKISVMAGKDEVDNAIFELALERQSHRVATISKTQQTNR